MQKNEMGNEISEMKYYLCRLLIVYGLQRKILKINNAK